MQLSKETSLFNKDSIKDDIQTAEKEASSYITRINNDGIFVHQADSEKDGDIPTDPTAYGVHISNDVEIIQGGQSVAEYGSTARIGAAVSSRFLMNERSLQAYDNSNNKYFEVSASGMSYGSNNVATTAYADQAEADAIATSEAFATTKANEARKYADNYLYYFNSTDGLAVASANPSTATRKVQITSSAVKVQNDGSNHADVTSDGLEVFKGGTSVAQFGKNSEARVGPQSTRHIEIKSGGLQVYKDSSNVMAHLGYGSGKNSSGGTSNNIPYFTFGTRSDDTKRGDSSVAEGYLTEASAAYTHAQNEGTIANMTSQTVIGTYNVADSTTSGGHPQYNNIYYGKYAFIIGNGAKIGNAESRSNALTVDWYGNVNSVRGAYYSGGEKLITVHYVQEDNISVPAATSSSMGVNSSISIPATISGRAYTPIGVVGYSIINASSSGTRYTYCTVTRCRLSDDSVKATIVNRSTAGAAKVLLTVDVLYIAGFQGIGQI